MKARETILVAPPQPGDFLCVPVSGEVGKLIEIGQFLAGQKFQPYEHAEVYVGQPDSASPWGYTVSAYPNRQGRQPLGGPPGSVPGALWSSALVPLTDAQRASIVLWALANQHVGYSAADYFALAAARLKMNLLLPPLRDFIKDSGHLICSQFVTLAYYQAGVDLLGGTWNGLDDPMQLAEMLEARLAERN
jgi:hypothetical protein